jgi:hypothetical protein
MDWPEAEVVCQHYPSQVSSKVASADMRTLGDYCYRTPIELPDLHNWVEARADNAASRSGIESVQLARAALGAVIGIMTVQPLQINNHEVAPHEVYISRRTCIFFKKLIQDLQTSADL